MGSLTSILHHKDENNSEWESEGEESGSFEVAKSAFIPPLLPVPADISSAGDKLCETCTALELTARRFVILPGDPDNEQNVPDGPEIPLGFVKDIQNKTSCPFCRLVLVSLGGSKVLVIEGDGEPTSVVPSWNTDGPRMDPHQPWNRTPQIRVLRPHCNLGNGGFVRLVRLNFFPEITLLANDSPIPSQTFFARPIQQDKIDFGMVRNWLNLCETWHGDDCNEVEMLDTITHPADEIPEFRVIDVVDNCLVYGESSCTYAALSYVWDPGALKLPEFYDQIPCTIRDAMQATREIGLRYLWVDTTGDSANVGLLGVRSGTRNYRQPVEELTSGFRLAFKPRIADYLADAVYETRGWTFQEKLFSRRSLQFIGGGVVFQCRRGNEWREDVVFGNETGIIGDLGVPDEDNDIGNSEGLIQSYSGLSFTFDSGIYFAFAGIAKHISRGLKSDLCHGIPKAYFDWFLLSTNLEHQTRRKRAPNQRHEQDPARTAKPNLDNLVSAYSARL
ncbi:uncharacterized protein PAC_18427 [Phialocephala subalpina]|uniref:Heterokaryon incompatibility domain-containing protein n=1 Tax=Phialocephala subalpina TaxID=576137 RepID=A0A1L7XU35_9HELO|nr:uncharacterized protein PAC_18427 [Phialocephala subalpina]